MPILIDWIEKCWTRTSSPFGSRFSKVKGQLKFVEELLIISKTILDLQNKIDYHFISKIYESLILLLINYKIKNV
jgi:hypothetical protein